MYKQVQFIKTAQPQRVGDGFIGKNAFHPQESKAFSPFLLLDHHGPMQIAPSERQRGVDEHPHRGFETVTVVYAGALEHRDSAGNYGKLFPGDVQWMTAASGIVHEEKHEKEFSKTGGTLEFVQLWVNLPAKFKMQPPRYQEIPASLFPSAKIANGVQLRVIAGEWMGMRGAAQTFSPVLLADADFEANQTARLIVPEGFNFLIYVLNGQVTLNQDKPVSAGQLATFAPNGDTVEITAVGSAKLMFLGGEPIAEPLATYGPFVMNSMAELQQAVADFQAGKMGRL